MNNISHFGNKKVTSKEKTRLVQKVFSDIASKYDLMNDIMSFGTHRLWKKRFVEYINPLNNEKIIDVGSGSGDLVKEILKKNYLGQIHVVDLNNDMLQLAKKRLKKNKNIFFYLNDAENLKFKNNYFDKYLISFCLRNITNINKSIEEAYRVLKPGGRYFSLEFSNPNSILTSSIYKKYKSKIFPILGKFIANNDKAYTYLSESIDLFPDQKKLKEELTKVGFYNVSYKNLFNGIVSIHSGYKI